MPVAEDWVYHGYRTELQRIALITGCLLLAGILAGHVMAVLLSGLVIYILWNLHHARLVLNWIKREDDSYPPPSSGIWESLTGHIYRQRRQNRITEAHLRTLTERIVLLTAALDEGMMTLDNDGALEWFNSAAAKLLKLRKSDRGHPITNLLRDPDFLHFIQKGDFQHTLELLSNDGQTSLLFSGALFGQGAVVIMVRDVTRLRALENMRKDFVANISHELRTPLTVLCGYLESLEDISADLSPTWQRAIQQMTQQTQRMNNLAGDLLMLSRMESLDVRPNPQLVPLLPLLEDVIGEARHIASATFQFFLDCPPHLALLGEHGELTSVFSNLIFNAVRHNPEGATIAVAVTQNEDELCVSISDNGMGIDPKHLPRLTERFYRAESSRATGTGGTGLGLAIVKHALNRHEGRLEIQSTLGKGSRFICHFPVDRVDATWATNPQQKLSSTVPAR